MAPTSSQMPSEAILQPLTEDTTPKMPAVQPLMQLLPSTNNNRRPMSTPGTTTTLQQVTIDTNNATANVNHRAPHSSPPLPSPQTP